MGRNKHNNHNISLTFYKKKPYSETAESLCIMYNYGKISKKRNSPVTIPQKIFNKKGQCIKKEYREKYKVAHEWISDFNDRVNDIEISLHNGTIDYEQAFRILKNEYETELIKTAYPIYADERGVKKSIIAKTMQYLTQLENKLKKDAPEYSDLLYDHIQRPSDINKIQSFIDKMDIYNGTKKKYLNYLNKMASVNPNFTSEQRKPFAKRYEHGSKAQQRAVTPKEIKLAIGTIEDNPYKLEALLWWLLSFCLRGIDCADILVLDSSKIEGEKKGDLRHYLPQMSSDNAEKFYYVGKRVKMQDRKAVPLKILLNIYPVLTIHKMLRRLVRYIHPDIAYNGSDPFKIYNLDYSNEDHKKRWRNRLGTMTDNVSRLFGATMKQSRHTFSTILAQILNVSYTNAEKQLSTALGHTNSSTQKIYVNPDQIRQDLLQIEVIERFDIRKIVKNIIHTCEHYTFKHNSKDIKLVEKKNLSIKYLDIPATIWNWQKELEWSHERLKSYSDVDTIIKNGKPIQKEIYRPTNRFMELTQERIDRGFETFVADIDTTKKTMGKIHKKLKEMGAFQ